MRVTAKPGQATRVIDVGATPPAPPSAAAPPSRPPHPPVVTADAPRLLPRAPRLIWAAAAVVSVVGGSLFLVVDALTGPSSVSTLSPSPSDTVSRTPSTGLSGSATPSGSPSGTPSDTAVPSETPSVTSLPSTSPTPGPGADTGPPVLLVALVVVAAVLLVVLLLWLLLVRRRRSTPVHGWQPVRRLDNAALLAEDRPRASLGTPDVLVLTPATTEDDPRLRDHLAQEKDAIFANLQLACSFRPARDWVFTGARLTVVLARADGKAAPAPIAYSLRPLSELDGTARENNVEIGADVKFVSAKAAQKSTRGGKMFVRGYGLQESTSFWEFTPTRARPLEGSFWLWLIAKAPLETDLAITSSLLVRVSPRRWWRAASPPAEGIGTAGLVLHLKDGPPYRSDPVDESDLQRRGNGA
jgi:hypothetical protein